MADQKKQENVRVISLTQSFVEKKLTADEFAIGFMDFAKNITEFEWTRNGHSDSHTSHSDFQVCSLSSLGSHTALSIKRPESDEEPVEEQTSNIKRLRLGAHQTKTTNKGKS